jgi:hypothetical protein
VLDRGLDVAVKVDAHRGSIAERAGLDRERLTGSALGVAGGLGVPLGAGRGQQHGEQQQGRERARVEEQAHRRGLEHLFTSSMSPNWSAFTRVYERLMAREGSGHAAT